MRRGRSALSVKPTPSIFPWPPSPKVTFPPWISSTFSRHSRVPVMCLEQPLSKYHGRSVCLALSVDVYATFPTIILLLMSSCRWSQFWGSDISSLCCNTATSSDGSQSRMNARLHIMAFPSLWSLIGVGSGPDPVVSSALILSGETLFPYFGYRSVLAIHTCPTLLGSMKHLLVLQARWSWFLMKWQLAALWPVLQQNIHPFFRLVEDTLKLFVVVGLTKPTVWGVLELVCWEPFTNVTPWVRSFDWEQ